jgi:hypothetical protein
MTPARAWRIGVIGGGVALLGAFALLYAEAPGPYFAILRAWGLDPFRFPFLDTHAVLAAIECTGRGFDPYLYDPCDVLTRAHVYSPLFLEAATLPVTVAWTTATGIALSLMFIVAVASLPAPRDRVGRTIMGLALVSTMTGYAIERGNNDLLIFVLVTIVGHLASRGTAARTVGYGAILFAILLKYYPAILLLLTLRERARRFMTVTAIVVVAVALFAIHYRRALAEGSALVPFGSHFTDFFGAVNLPFGLTELLKPVASSGPAAAAIISILSWLVLILLIGSSILRGLELAREAPLASLAPAEGMFLVMGAALIAGTFFAGQNIDYRGIFLLLALPGLTALGPRYRGAAIMILFLMWGEMFREALSHIAFADPTLASILQTVRVVFWFVRELIWWRVVAVLLGIVFAHVASSEIGRAVGSRLGVMRLAPR